MRSFFAIVVVAMLFQPAFGQGADTASKSWKRFFAIKVAPLSLIDFSFPSAQAGAELFFLKKISVAADVAYADKAWGFDMLERTDIEGHKERLQFRIYNGYYHGVRGYFGGEIFHKKQSFGHPVVGGYECEMGSCDYFRFESLRITRQSLAASVIFGTQWNYGRLLLDLNMFFGLRANREMFNTSSSARELYEEPGTFYPRDYTFPGVYGDYEGGFHLGFTFRTGLFLF